MGEYYRTIQVNVIIHVNMGINMLTLFLKYHYLDHHFAAAKFSNAYTKDDEAKACVLSVLSCWVKRSRKVGIPLRQRLPGTGSFWNRYEIGTDKPCVYTGLGGSGTDRICYWYQIDPLMKVTYVEPYRSSLEPVPCKQSGFVPEWVRSQTDLNIFDPV